MSKTTLLAICASAAMIAGSPIGAFGSEDAAFALSVSRAHVFGSSSGTLRITAAGLAYDTVDKDDVR